MAAELTTAGVVLAAAILGAFLAGIRLMQSPRTALWGNRLGALAMTGAIIWTYLLSGRGSATEALLYLAAGAVIGLALGQGVKMIHMPQTVALLNGLGGGASTLVVLAALQTLPGGDWGSDPVFLVTAGIAVAVGSLTFGGSAVAVIKLHGLGLRGALQIPGHAHLLRAALFGAALLITINAAAGGAYSGWAFPLALLLGLAAGLLMALRIGGADMPIIISLLNSFSGIAAAIAGLAVMNLVQAGTGALVGVAGIILTRIMCRAMNRSLPAVLAGFTPGGALPAKQDSGPAAQAFRQAGEPGPLAAVPGQDGNETAEKQTAGDIEPGVAASGGAEGETPDREESGEAVFTEEELPALLRAAKKVIIVPGYGMAVAQAQLAVGQLAAALTGGGAEVSFAIHPVAGRMPGHMSVLLAEAGIDYDQLVDLEDINPRFGDSDLSIIVGACDVVNPAANAADGTPISGMPILLAGEAKRVVVLNIDEKPGYSGVDNLLYRESHVLTLWGDAAETTPRLTAMLKEG